MSSVATTAQFTIASIDPRRSSTTSDTTLSNRSSTTAFPFLHPTKWTFDCIQPECKEQFNLTNELYDHVRAHDKGLSCPICKNTFKCMASLVYHVRTHTGNKPYCCPLPICNFVTATKGNLKAHLLSNQHRDSMSLDLLNCILAMDTNHGRPELHLHAPRERKKKRSLRQSMDQIPQIQMFQPLRKRVRSDSYDNSNSLVDDMELAPLEIGASPQYHVYPPNMYYSPVSQVPPIHNAAFNTNNYYGSAPIRSPATSLTHQWQNFDFLAPPLSEYSPTDSEQEREDLTIRIKLDLMKAIENAERYTHDINRRFSESDKFAMALEGMEDTKGYYTMKLQNSAFNFSDSNSNSMRVSRRGSMDDFDFDLIPPLDF